MRKGYTAFAAIVATAIVATPLLMGAGKALAVSEPNDAIATAVAVTTVEVTPVAASVVTEPCLRKVRVVYGGYGNPPVTCTALR